MTQTWQFITTHVWLIADALAEMMATLSILLGQAGSNSDNEDDATMSDASEEDSVSPPAKMGSNVVVTCPRVYGCNRSALGLGSRASVWSNSESCVYSVLK
jgi:hypothetical protein